MSRAHRQRIATIRALAPPAVSTARDRQHQIDEIEEADDAKEPENLPAVSHASHYS